MIRYTIKLTKSEVEELHAIINKGSHTSQTFRTAYILLNCDAGKYSDKVTNDQLLLKIVTNEFTKPFSKDSQAYLFSSAVANYFLDTISTENERIDGLVYPTCLGKNGIRNLGLNYVFRRGIVGFDNKIEFHDAYRSKMEKTGFEYHQTQIIKFKKAYKFTGEIFW